MVLQNEEVDKALGFVRALEAREPISSKASWRELIRILEAYQEHTLLLQERVGELEAKHINMHADLGEMISAVSAESVTFYEELKLAMVALVKQTNKMGQSLEKKVADAFTSHESSIRKMGRVLYRITKSMGGSVSSLQSSMSTMDEKFEAMLQRIETVENRLVDLEKKLEQLDNLEKDRRDADLLPKGEDETEECASFDSPSPTAETETEIESEPLGCIELHSKGSR